MNLGVFDSGLGGLLIAKSIRAQMPNIDMIYYGDTLHLPYGNRSAEAIYE
ncbi:MAG: glutamate racemase, partial [Alphaproteobacteria bacterium]